MNAPLMFPKTALIPIHRIGNQPLSIFFLLPDQAQFQKEVRARAYEVYLQYAEDEEEDGIPEEDWYEAEAEIRLSYGMPPRA